MSLTQEQFKEQADDLATRMLCLVNNNLLRKEDNSKCCKHALLMLKIGEIITILNEVKEIDLLAHALRVLIVEYQDENGDFDEVRVFADSDENAIKEAYANHIARSCTIYQVSEAL